MMLNMIRQGMIFILLTSLISGFSYASSKAEFSEGTLYELSTKAEKIWREFGANNSKQQETQGFVEQQILLKHGQAMYEPWSQVNN